MPLESAEWLGTVGVPALEQETSSSDLNRTRMGPVWQPKQGYTGKAHVSCSGKLRACQRSNLKDSGHCTYAAQLQAHRPILHAMLSCMLGSLMTHNVRCNPKPASPVMVGNVQVNNVMVLPGSQITAE